MKHKDAKGIAAKPMTDNNNQGLGQLRGNSKPFS